MAENCRRLLLWRKTRHSVGWSAIYDRYRSLAIGSKRRLQIHDSGSCFSLQMVEPGEQAAAVGYEEVSAEWAVGVH